MKILSFAVPCYNSALYMGVCIESLLAAGDDVEIIIVNDGSTKDDTAEVADEWAARHPDVIRVIHKENGGHGSAVNAGLEAARGLYFKVVDSDDWLDGDALAEVMTCLREQASLCVSDDCDAGGSGTNTPGANTPGASGSSVPDDPVAPVDLLVTNYVYEKVHEDKRTVIGYRNVFPARRGFTWRDIGRFSPNQYLLMHSVIYRTELLRKIGLKLPHHCFYVDNIFVYVPLPAVRTIHYIPVDLYRYYIGRADQSVNESVMRSRIDQQIRITKEMIDAVNPKLEVPERKLARYMEGYLSMMLCICSVFLRMEKSSEAEQKREEIWGYLEARDKALYRRVRTNVLNLSTNIPTNLGRHIGLGGYRVARKIFKFN